MKKIIIMALAVVSVSALVGCDKKTQPLMPSQSYIGAWRDEYQPPNSLTILAIGDSTIQFELIIFRISAATGGTAKIENNKIVFDTEISISGTMEFYENGIKLNIEKSENDYYRPGDMWDFKTRITEADEADGNEAGQTAKLEVW